MEVTESTTSNTISETEGNNSESTVHKDCQVSVNNLENESSNRITKDTENMIETENSGTIVFDKAKETSFKTPMLLIGPRRGKLGKLRILTNRACIVTEKDANEPNIPNSMEGTDNTADITCEVEDSSDPKNEQPESPNARDSGNRLLSCPYKEPPWAGLPENVYKLEVLKSGVILDTVDLTTKSFHVLGRLPTCDIPLAHPTISRYHAILQYRLQGDVKNPRGLYLYDLGSTHGSFWNGYRVKPNMYVRLHSGHMIKFGCSQRKFIIYGPPDDEEEETTLTLTELKEQRRLELEKRERAMQELKLKEEEEEQLRKEKEENEGIDWGMGEDADEETDLSENPYAATNNEELFLDDPKKTLRGWFEREGFDLQYQTEEKGIGQFLCWVELPIDSVTGKSVRAEALVKGKKKESVIQCALEACRILDRHGVLRQAHHEARKRKARNWEDEDFYDSDEDNFLDRTGAIEKKRLQRMQQAGKVEQTVETYTSLLEKHRGVAKKIAVIEKALQKARDAKNVENDDPDEDALDTFMSNLKSALPNKNEIIKMKLELQTLRKEESRLIALVNIAKPADLPALKPQTTVESVLKQDKRSDRSLPMIGSRKGSKIVQEPESNNAQSGNQKISNTELINVYKSNLMEKDELDSIESNKTDRSIDDDQMNLQSDDNSKNVSEASVALPNAAEEIERQRKKKKNQKRIQQRLEKAEKSKQTGYENDIFKEDYSMWVPPENQTGDGKTNLNEKFGY